GLKKHAKAYIALTAPTVTSYKRLVIGARSGSAWAPVYISYGWNNRTQMLRIPDAGRIEDRTVDGSCNPYLAATAVLACGLDGIEKGLDAARALEGDDVLREALGNTGREDYIDYYVRVKQREWSEIHEQVTQAEVDRYLQLF